MCQISIQIIQFLSLSLIIVINNVLIVLKYIILNLRLKCDHMRDFFPILPKNNRVILIIFMAIDKLQNCEYYFWYNHERKEKQTTKLKNKHRGAQLKCHDHRSHLSYHTSFPLQFYLEGLTS